jgi:hypothetical protein
VDGYQEVDHDQTNGCKQPLTYFGRFLGSLTNLILDRFDSDAWRPLREGACHVIRTVALGVVCLAGLGAIAAAAKKPSLPQPAEVVFPKVAGSKADRLPLIPRLGTRQLT